MHFWFGDSQPLACGLYALMRNQKPPAVYHKINIAIGKWNEPIRL